MGAFSYVAVDHTTGKETAGQVEATDEAQVRKQLRASGLTPVKVTAGASVASKQLSLPSFGVKARDVTLFSRQFATMVGAGLSILRCLMILETQVSSAKLREQIVDVRSQIESGRGLSDSLSRHPKTFDRLYTSMVAAGEVGGVLDMTLRRVADQLEARDSLKRKVKSAMTYPVVVLIFAIVAAFFMIIFIVPRFKGIFESVEGKLPAVTQMLVDFSEALRTPLGIVLTLAVPIGSFFAFRAWKRTESGRRQWDRIKLKFPKIGGIVQKIALARFSRTLSALIASGVPIMQAVQVTGDSAGNSVIEDAMDDIVASIESGRTFSEPLNRHPIFPPMVIQMAAIGEETGQLDTMLEKVAEFYEDEVDAAVKSLTSVVEPLLMIFVGIIVGAIVFALYMPMFSIFEQVK